MLSGRGLGSPDFAAPVIGPSQGLVACARRSLRRKNMRHNRCPVLLTCIQFRLPHADMGRRLGGPRLDDRELVERARSDPEAYGVLFDRYYTVVLNYVARRTNDVALAHDLTSETFYKAFRGIRKFQWRGIPFSAWLYRIASNEVAAHFRGRSRLESLEHLAEVWGFDPASSQDLEAELIQAQSEFDRHVLYRSCVTALSELPLKYQEVIALRFFEDKSIAEIGQILGRSQGTVKSQLHRGLARIEATAPKFLQEERNLPRVDAFNVQED